MDHTYDAQRYILGLNVKKAMLEELEFLREFYRSHKGCPPKTESQKAETYADMMVESTEKTVYRLDGRVGEISTKVDEETRLLRRRMDGIESDVGCVSRLESTSNALMSRIAAVGVQVDNEELRISALEAKVDEEKKNAHAWYGSVDILEAKMERRYQHLLALIKELEER